MHATNSQGSEKVNDLISTKTRKNSKIYEKVFKIFTKFWYE
jgi:hypothetical protein